MPAPESDDVRAVDLQSTWTARQRESLRLVASGPLRCSSVGSVRPSPAGRAWRVGRGQAGPGQGVGQQRLAAAFDRQWCLDLARGEQRSCAYESYRMQIAFGEPDQWSPGEWRR